MTLPVSRSDDAIHIETVICRPMKNMILMYSTPWSRIADASVFPMTISDSTCLGKTMQTRKYGMNAARPAISLNLNACFIPFGSSAPKNCVRYMPPDMQMVFRNIMKTNSICPAILTPDMETSPSPATMKLSISETRFCISCCSMIGSAIESAFP